MGEENGGYETADKDPSSIPPQNRQSIAMMSGDASTTTVTGYKPNRSFGRSSYLRRSGHSMKSVPHSVGSQGGDASITFSELDEIYLRRRQQQPKWRSYKRHHNLLPPNCDDAESIVTEEYYTGGAGHVRPADRARVLSSQQSRRETPSGHHHHHHLPDNRYRVKPLPGNNNNPAAVALSAASEIPPALPERNKIPPRRNSRYQNLPASGRSSAWDDDVISNLHGVALPSRGNSLVSIGDGERPLPSLPVEGSRRSKSFSQKLKRIRSFF